MKKPQKTQKTKGPAVTGNWLYLMKGETGLREIYEKIMELSYEAEIWEDAGVLELVYGEKHSIDFETADLKRADEATIAYLEKNGIHTVFLVSFYPEEYSAVKEIFQKLLISGESYFCADTEEFSPVIR